MVSIVAAPFPSLKISDFGVLFPTSKRGVPCQVWFPTSKRGFHLRSVVSIVEARFPSFPTLKRGFPPFRKDVCQRCVTCCEMFIFLIEHSSSCVCVGVICTPADQLTSSAPFVRLDVTDIPHPWLRFQHIVVHTSRFHCRHPHHDTKDGHMTTVRHGGHMSCRVIT